MQNLQIFAFVLFVVNFCNIAGSTSNDGGREIFQQILLQKGLNDNEYVESVENFRAKNPEDFAKYMADDIKHASEWNREKNNSSVIYKILKDDHAQAMQLLLHNGLSQNFKAAYDEPGIYAADRLKAYRCMESLLKAGADLNAACDSNRLSFLEYAAEQGLVNVIRAAIAQNVDVFQANKDGVTLLNRAAHRKYLVGNTPEKYEATQLLLQHGKGVYKPSNLGSTLIRVNSPKIGLLLMDHGADVNVQDGCGNGAVHYATCEDNYDMLELLIDKHANINLLNAKNQTPLDYYYENHYLGNPRGKMWALLQRAGAKKYADLIKEQQAREKFAGKVVGSC